MIHDNARHVTEPLCNYLWCNNIGPMNAYGSNEPKLTCLNHDTQGIALYSLSDPYWITWSRQTIDSSFKCVYRMSSEV